MTVCPFCDIANKRASAVIVWEDSDIVAFLDTRPIRKGHCLIIPKRHIESFEEVPSRPCGKNDGTWSTTCEENEGHLQG